MIRWNLLPLFLGALLCTAGCNLGSSPNGGGTEGEGLTGILHDPQGLPVAGALVRVFPDAGSALSRSAAAAAHVFDSVHTNSLGYFRFDSLPEGAYGLLASMKRRDTTLVLLIQGISFDGDEKRLGTRTLGVGGTLRLNVRGTGEQPLRDALCRVVNTPFSAPTDSLGDCTIGGMPPGNYAVLVSRPGFVEIRTGPLEVRPGEVSSQGPWDLPPATRPPGQAFTRLASTLALWTFNEPFASPPVVAEAGGNGFNLNALGEPSRIPSEYGYALSFEPASGSPFLWGRPPEPNPFLTARQITVEARIRLSAYPDAANTDSAAHVAGSLGRYSLLVRRDGALGIGLSMSGYGELYAAWTLPGTVPLNRWVNLAIATDPDRLTGYAYVDGKPVRLYNSNGALLLAQTPLQDEFTVAGSPGTNRPFHGQIDEVRVSSGLVLGEGLPLERTAPLGRRVLVASQDASIYGAVPGSGHAGVALHRNYGGAESVAAMTYDARTASRALIRFSLPAAYRSADIRSAVIRLTPQGWTAKNARRDFRIDVHRMLKGWREGNSAGGENGPSVDGATGGERFWGEQNGQEDWSQPLVGLNGLDAAASPSAAVVKPSQSQEAWEFDVTALAKAWADDSSTNFGVLLATPFPANDTVTWDFPVFHSREAAVADSNKPVLILNGTPVSTPPLEADSWTTRTVGPSQSFMSMTFPTSQVGYLGGDDAQGSLLFKTLDGGANWTRIDPALTLSEKVGRSLWFLNKDTGWAAGGTETRSAVIKTTNGGATWTNHPAPNGKFIYRIHFVDAHIGWVVGKGGTISKSTDGGATWTAQASGVTDDLIGAFFLSGSKGFVAGTGGYILATEDGGATWTKRYTSNAPYLWDVFFQSPDTGYVAGWSGTLLKTTNGGATWFPLVSGTTLPLRSIRFRDAANGVASGGQTGGRVLLTTNDGGATWRKEPVPWGNGLNAVAFPDPSGTRVAGDQGVVLTNP